MNTTLIREAITATGRDVAFLVQTGSRAYGTSTPDSDTDLVGFYVENDRETFGLQRAQLLKLRILDHVPVDEHGRELESVIAHLSGGACLQKLGTGLRDDRASGSDIEMLLVPLREFVSLAAAGNPEFVSPLFTPLDSDLVVHVDERGEYLARELRGLIVTKHACFRYAGYARSQRDVVLGNKKRRTNRHDLVAAHGYDTKAGSHLLRLLIVGCQLLDDRTIHLPMHAHLVNEVMSVRNGQMPLEKLITVTDLLEQDLTEDTQRSDLPDEVDMARIDEVLYNARHLAASG